MKRKKFKIFLIFEKNLLLLQKLHCHNHNRCLIDLDSRRFCKRCRLQKCFDAGMDKVKKKSLQFKKLLKSCKTYQNKNNLLGPSPHSTSSNFGQPRRSTVHRLGTTGHHNSITPGQPHPLVSSRGADTHLQSRATVTL